jgi:hypothetical protein
MNYDEYTIEDPVVTCLKQVYIGINIFFSIVLALYIFKTAFNSPSILGKLSNFLLYIFFFPIYMVKYIFECQRKN